MWARILLILSLVFSHLAEARFTYLTAHENYDTEDEGGGVWDSNLATTPATLDAGGSSIYISHRRHDCHGTIASILDLHCGEKENGMSEAEQKALSISFTICAMRSAYQTIPFECEVWDPMREEGEMAETRSVAAIGRCLEALHRSPQDYNTFQGYMREATQLCLALSGHQESSQAKQLYRNATIENIQLLRQLQRNQEQQQVSQQFHDDRMTSHLDVLQSSTNVAQQILDDLLDQARLHAQIYEKLATSLSTFKEESSATNLDITSEMRHRGTEIVNDLVSMVNDLISDADRQLSNQLNSIVTNHQEALFASQTEVRESMLEAKDLMREYTSSATSQAVEMVARMGSDVDGLSSAVRVMTNEISTSGETAKGLSLMLQLSKADASMFRDLQRETSTSIMSAGQYARDLENQLQGSNTQALELLSLLQASTRMATPSRWLRQAGSLNLFGASFFAPSWLDNSNSYQSTRTILRLTGHIGGALLDATFAVLCTLVGVLGSLWLILRPFLWRLACRFGRGLQDDARVLLQRETDEERDVPIRKAHKPKAPSSVPPAYTPLPRETGVERLYPWNALQLNDPTTVKTSPAGLSRTNGARFGRRAVSMPP